MPKKTALCSAANRLSEPRKSNTDNSLNVSPDQKKICNKQCTTDLMAATSRPLSCCTLRLILTAN